MNITIFIEILNIYHLGMQITITDISRLTICLYAGLFNINVLKLLIFRAFLKFDGHLIKNGFKIVASSVKKMHMHEFGPK